MRFETEEDLWAAIESAIDVDYMPSKWGTSNTYVIAREGKFWEFTVEMNSHDGHQWEGPVEAYEVERIMVERVSWRRV